MVVAADPSAILTPPPAQSTPKQSRGKGKGKGKKSIRDPPHQPINIEPIDNSKDSQPRPKERKLSFSEVKSSFFIQLRQLGIDATLLETDT